MPGSSVPHLEVLLRQSSWAQALARRLVEDASEADELVQEAFVVALQSAPSKGVPILSWFATVMRNLARARWRARVRRELRERACARREATCQADEVLERFEQQRLLAEDMREIQEPYRSALLMRYFDGLRPEEIARRSDESVRTIHSRLHRGLALLRERLLRRTGGDARAWTLALVPLGFGRDGFSGSLLGGWIVNTQLKVTAAVIAIGALAVTVTNWPMPEPLAPPAFLPEVVSKAGIEPEPGVHEKRDSIERAEVASIVPAPAPSTVEPAAVPIEVTVSGRVVDPEGLPLMGLEIGVRGYEQGSQPQSTPRAFTLADGSFVLRGHAFSGRLTIVSQDWIAIFESTTVAPDTGPEVDEGVALILAARALSISGTVVDARASPIANAELEYVIPPDLRARFPGLLDAASTIQCSARSDARGSFQLPRVPDAAGGKLRARSAGFEDGFCDVPGSSRDDLVIVLQTKPDVAFLPGMVVDPDGAPVEGALVVLGNANTRSDASGNFLLPLGGAGDASVIRAVKRGYLPAAFECGSLGSSDPGAWPRPFLLELGDPPLSLSGIVVDAGGHPIPRAPVSIVNRSFLGVIDVRFGTERVQAPQWIESELNGAFSDGSVRSDEHGRFRLEGLLARPYTLQTFHPRTLAHAVVSGIAAGREDVEIRLTCEKELPAIRGRVIGRSGTPIEGASVLPVRKVLCNYQETTPPFGEREVSGDGAPSDEDGRFELRSLCSDTFALRVLHPNSFGSTTVELHELASLDDIEIVLSLDCHLQIDLEGSSIQADALSLLDSAGKDVTLVVYHGDISYAGQRFGIEGKKTEAFVVPEDAATLVLLNGEEEVARIPLHLQAGELNVIRP